MPTPHDNPDPPDQGTLPPMYFFIVGLVFATFTGLLVGWPGAIGLGIVGAAAFVSAAWLQVNLTPRPAPPDPAAPKPSPTLLGERIKNEPPGFSAPPPPPPANEKPMPSGPIDLEPPAAPGTTSGALPTIKHDEPH